MRARSRALLRARALRYALWPLGAAAGIVAARGQDAGGGQDLATALAVVAGWSFIASGLVGWSRRPANRVGPLMVAVGFLWFAGAVLTRSDASLAFTAGAWLGDLWPVAFALLLAAFPLGLRVPPLERALVATVFAVMVPLELAWLLFFEFPDGAPENALLVWPDAGVASALDGVQRAVLLVALGALAVALVHRWLQAAAPLRRALLPVLVGAVAVLLYDAVLWADKLGIPHRGLDDVFRVVFAAVPLVFLAGLLRARLARSAVGDLLVDLGAPRPPGAMRDALARALGDPGLELAYWTPEYARYVGVDGQEVALPGDDDARVATFVERDGRPLVAVVHDAALRDEPELVGAACAATGMTLENERLQADLRARLEELRGSRARLVEAGDAERRRLERNLHDGAQQRLVSLAVLLRLLAGRLDPESEEARILAPARAELTSSLAELRSLAQGIHPAVLSDHGLAVALQSVAARSPVRVRLAVELDSRPTPAAEVAAYYVVCEGLANVAKYASADGVDVAVTRRDGRLRVELRDDGVGGADPALGSGLRGLADRVEALGGQLRLWSPPGRGTTVRAEIPCE